MTIRKRFFAIASLFMLIFCGKLSALDSKLVIIRHGEGEHNQLHIYSTWTQEEGGVDHPLTEKGKLQVAKTAQKLFEQGFNRETVGLVLVSPLLRTRQTAQILVDKGICSEKMIFLEERIREPRAQDWEGASTPPKQPHEDRWTAIVEASALHRGETVKAIEQRLESVLTKLSQWDPAKGHVILVTHGYPSQILLKIYGEKNTHVDTGEARILPLKLPD